MRPRIFIASSVEGLSVAYAAQECLEHDCEITVWPQGVFELTKTVLESLDKRAKMFDAAIFVFCADDVSIVRGTERPAVRDNVLFEMGLFIGRLGRDKCFIAKPRSFNQAHFPTDLLGIHPGDYDDARSDDNLVAAVGPFCNKVRRALGASAEKPKDKSPSDSLESILLSGAFRLCFNPPSRSKRVVFSPDGLITEGNNKNEHSWRIVNGKLELVQLDGRVHSRFFYDTKEKRFKHTGDEDTVSIRGQYITPDG